MKLLTLKINEKTYTTGKITAFFTREALKIQKEAITLAKKGKVLQEPGAAENLDAVEEVLDSLAELKERKVWLLCEIYGNKFTTDDIEKELSDEEIEIEVNKIIMGISGVIQKN